MIRNIVLDYFVNSKSSVIDKIFLTVYNTH